MGFVFDVSTSSSSASGCAGHGRVLKLARTLSDDLITDPSSGYGVHGLFGIFAAGDPLNNAWSHNISWLRSSKNYVDYQGVKTNFLYSKLCQAAAAKPSNVHTICEVGFNAGLSAMLLLEAAPDANVISFDLGDQPWSRVASNLLLRAYSPARTPAAPAKPIKRMGRFLGVVFGDSKQTIPEYKRTHPNFRCDVAFIDGDKSYEGRKKSLSDLRAMSAPNALIFLDEVTSQSCVNGSLPSDRHQHLCQRLNPPYYAAVRAYDNFVRHGKMRVLECVWPLGRFHNRDGFCSARFT